MDFYAKMGPFLIIIDLYMQHQHPIKKINKIT